jgi:hypothetical protein
VEDLPRFKNFDHKRLKKIIKDFFENKVLPDVETKVHDVILCFDLQKFTNLKTKYEKAVKKYLDYKE